MLTTLLLAAITMNTDTVAFVGRDFREPDVPPPEQIEQIVQEAARQRLELVAHDTVSLFHEDGSSFHAVRVIEGEPIPPLRSFKVSRDDYCLDVAKESLIEITLRELDANPNLDGDAYLRSTYDAQVGRVRFRACRARLRND